MIEWLKRLSRCRGLLRPRHFALRRAAARSADDRLELGGCEYRKMGPSTLDHDWRFVALLRELKLLEPCLSEGEPAADYGRRLLVELISSGRAGAVLGHLIMPAELSDEQWTPAVADATSAAIAGLTDEADKATVHSLTLGVLLDFFETGLNASLGSMISSTETSAGPKVASVPRASPIASVVGRP